MTEDIPLVDFAVEHSTQVHDRSTNTSVAVQTTKPKATSVAVQCNIKPLMVDVGTQCCLTIAEQQNQGGHKVTAKLIDNGASTDESTDESADGSADELDDESKDASSCSEDDDGESTEWSESETSDCDENENVCEVITSFVLKHMKEYLGIPKHAAELIDYIKGEMSFQEGHSHISSTDVIYIVLQKIRLNDSYSRLGHQYGISCGRVGQIVRTHLPVIANVLKPFLKWPTQSEIRERLPVQFRRRFSKVQSIIDAFEIEIQKPSDPFLQSCTWSEYKCANTFKYLISVTPDGLINFVSTGYGGKISDLEIVRISGYLDNLKPNMEIMADRGFKHINVLLSNKDCTLLRPPSVSKGQILSKEKTMEAKRIAATRVHVERAIGRLREFKFIAPHARTDVKQIGLLDDAVIIACVLVNMHKPLIR